MKEDNSIEILKKQIEKCDNIVFLGGAGVSTESNIPDFRSSDGLYKKKNYPYSPEYMLSHTFFVNHTEEFYEFYKNNLVYKDAKPNKAHIALSELEKMGKLKAVITQNIDGLHQMAGTKNVLELHGSIHRNYCMNCNKDYSLEFILESQGIPRCERCGGIVRPDVVLYEEMLDTSILERSIQYISNAKMLIVGGTSLNVYPAAGLISYFRGYPLVLINKEKTPFDNRADFIFREKIGEVLSKLI